MHVLETEETTAKHVCLPERERDRQVDRSNYLWVVKIGLEGGRDRETKTDRKDKLLCY